MKVHKLLIILTSILILSGCDMFKIDNYEGPNASISGGIKDEVTGALVETDIQTGTSQNGSVIKVHEKGWPEGTPISWIVKNSGEYQNDMVFAAHYRVIFEDCNFYPFNIDDLHVKKGKNTHDFQVTPYIRVKDVNITRSGDEIVATFKLQAGKPEVRLSAVRLFAFSDMYVGEMVKYNITGPAYQTFSPAATIDENTTYTLRIDIPSNKNEFFKYTNKNYYFRVGAIANVSGVGTVRHNYAPYVVIRF